MRVLVTGATGFVGRWLVEELRGAGHEPIASPASSELDIRDAGAVRKLVADARPSAIAHLAGVSYAGDAARDPEGALEINAGGTRAVIRAATDPVVPVLVSGSSEVYGNPRPEDLPLTEDAPLRVDQPYGRSKRAQESTALEAGEDVGVPVVVTRSFNHTGPGQRREFVAPSIAWRVIEAKRADRRLVPVGNLEVARDIGDVRDVVRAYRLLLEALVAGRLDAGTVLNVATGRSVSVRHLFGLIRTAARADVEPAVNAELVRQNDPPILVGDASRLHRLTGWAPRIPLEVTVGDLVASLEGQVAARES